MVVAKLRATSIQEHFKKNVGNFFNNQFNNFNNYVVPAVRENNKDSGRPKGGIAQLSNNKYKIKTVRIPTPKETSRTVISYRKVPLMCNLSIMHLTAN